jgi:3-oxoacyl-[acyl-carrier protein] reductase
MDLGLKDKVALVLAAGGGLGERIAVTLADEGAKVCLSDVNQTALDAVVSSIAKRGGTARGYLADLANLDALEEMTTQILKVVGGVDILVNITGGPPAMPMAGVGTDAWEKHFRAMVLSVIRITDLVLPGMRQRKWGRVITSASSGVVAPIPDLGLSNALRSTLVGWSKTLSREVAVDGVTVNVIVPGRIATSRIRQLDETRAAREQKPVDDIIKASTATIPMRRYGEPQEYADMVAFLASARASYVTGSILRVDGGLIGSI